MFRFHYSVRLISVCILFCIISFGIGVHADNKSPSGPITIRPTAVHTVYAKEYADSAHVHTSEFCWGMLISNFQSFDGYLDNQKSYFDVNSKMGSYPSLSEQVARYDEAFFQDRCLLIVNYEGYQLTDLSAPGYMAAPEFRGLYIQNGSLYVDTPYDWTVRLENIVKDSQFEYKLFIEVYKEDFSDFDIFGSQCEIKVLSNPNILPQAPQTSDPTTSLAITAAVSLTALCLVPVARKKRKIQDTE